MHGLSFVFPKLIYVLGVTHLNVLSLKAIDLDGHLALKIQYNLFNPFARLVKRVIDFLLYLVSLVGPLPLLMIFSFLIKIDSPGLIIYTQKRIGKEGRLINIHKFRTMEIGA